ncbi:hypothetical protein BGX21_001975 [Mortierella sp. AD011]|nr:hypothetical protein BGX20_001122 [Mortierella sp. AD010]KAF9381911.1 hypothetical protein BGX21_001975 [Mortierella sp. AD011]
MSNISIGQFQPWGRLGGIPPLTSLKLIGNGSFGQVYFWHHKDGRRMAVKRIRVAAKDNEKVGCIADIKKEMKIVSQLAHKNIIKCYGVDHDANDVFIVMEYAEGGSLQDYIDGENLKDVVAAPRLSWEDKMKIVVDVARGLAYLHKQGIIHRDIKGQNILLSKSKEAKLCDFGIAKVKTSAACVCSYDRRQRKITKGTPGFIAPELRKYEPEYSSMSDVYALGVVMQKLLCEDERPPQEYSEIMNSCLNEDDPTKRPTVEEIIKALDVVYRVYDMDAANYQAKTKQTVSVDEKPHPTCGLHSRVEVDVKCADKVIQFMGYAHKGNAAAQTILGYLHLYGIGVPSDSTRAVKWLEMAANRGFAVAQFDLGRILLAGEMGVPQDRSKALGLLEAAANQGNIDACTILGQVNLAGESEENDKEAVRWFLKAAEGGSAQAQARIGRMYYSGWGIEQNYTECHKFLMMAASQELPVAYLILGYLYRFGRGVPQDDCKATKWWLKAAEKGDMDGQYNVGFQYIMGQGVPKKSEYKLKGIEWMKKAKEQGHEMAQNLLEATDQELML